MNGRRNIVVIASLGLLFGSALVACQETTSPSQTSTSAVETEKNTLLTSRFGYVLPSVAEAAAGTNVTYKVVANDPEHFDPVAIEINGVRHDLDEEDSFTAPMAESGNEVFPIFKAVVDNFRVTPEYYSITVEKIDGALYKLSNGTWETEWQESNVFTDPKDDPEHRIVPHSTYQVSVYVPGQEEEGLLESDVATKTVQTVPNRETVMDKLRTTDFAYKGTVVVTQKSYGETTATYTIETETALTEDRFVVNLDATIDGQTIHESLSYVAGELGLLSQETVDYQNHVNVLPVDGQTLYASQFMNPFGTITNDEVSLNADESVLSVDTDIILYPELFPTYLCGMQATVTSVTVPVDADLNPQGLNFEGYVMESGAELYLSYSGTSVDPSTVKADAVEPFETLPEHSQLQSLFTDLAKHNYTVTVTDSNETGNTVLYVTPEQALFVNPDGTKSGIVQTENGFARFDVETKDGEEYMQGWEGYPRADHDIAEYQIPFSFAPEVFSYEDGTFHLRDLDNLYNVANYTLPDSINVDSKGYSYLDAGSLDITLDDKGGATFRYTYTDYTNQETGTITAVVSAIGSTTIPEMAFVAYGD